MLWRGFFFYQKCTLDKIIMSQIYKYKNQIFISLFAYQYNHLYQFIMKNNYDYH